MDVNGGTVHADTNRFQNHSFVNHIKSTENLITYRRRYYVLGIFSGLVWFQCLMWNTWGPISESVDAAFEGWGSDTVAMMANWGTFTFVIFVVPLIWFVDKKGLRAGVLTISGFVGVATAVRIIPLLMDNDSLFTVMCHITAILNGLVGPMVMSAPALIAAVWFPPRQRTSATAFGQLLNQLGNAGGYLEPLLVRSPSNATPDEIRSDISRLMYIYAGIGAGFFIIILIYFPARPPTPPSISSTEERLDFKDSFKKLLRNKQLSLVCLSMSVSVGVPAVWLTVLNYSLKPLGINQDEAMWVGLLAVVCSVVAGLVVSYLTDLLYGHLRVTIITMMLLDIAMFFWFFLLTWGCITVTKWQAYVSVIVGFSLNLSTMPLFTELAVEKAYPCSELVVASYLTGGLNVVGLIFLCLFFIPTPGYDWVTYLLLATSSLSIFPLLLVKEDHKRTEIDQGKTPLQNMRNSTE